AWFSFQVFTSDLTSVQFVNNGLTVLPRNFGHNSSKTGTPSKTCRTPDGHSTSVLLLRLHPSSSRLRRRYNLPPRGYREASVLTNTRASSQYVIDGLLGMLALTIGPAGQTLPATAVKAISALKFMTAV